MSAIRILPKTRSYSAHRRNPDHPPPPRRTWGEAVRRWLLLGQHRAPETRRREHFILLWLRPRLPDDMALMEITPDLLDDLRAAKLAEGAGPRSANYVVGVVSAILTAAVDWGWMAKAPRLKPLKTPPSRVRWLTPAEAERLLEELRPPLRDMAAFSLETGLRWGNVAGLRWTHVDLRASLVTFSAAETKGRAGLALPLTERACAILRGQEGRHPSWVFTSQGKKVQRPPRHSWYGAMQRAGLEDFRWHDLRHTWASWHAQRGTPMLILQQLGGWKTPAMVARYAHLDTRALTAHVQGFDRWVRGRGRDEDQAARATGGVD